MNIFLNGNVKTVQAHCTITDLLNLLDLQTKRVAVEVNGQIIVRSEHASHRLNSDDTVEIVVAVGGG
jgi:sulfur carrier protein